MLDEWLDNYGLTVKFNEETKKLDTIKKVFGTDDVDFWVKLLIDPDLREETYQKVIEQCGTNKP